MVKENVGLFLCLLLQTFQVHHDKYNNKYTQ